MAETRVKLYRFCNSWPGDPANRAALRLAEELDAKETPTAYTYPTKPSDHYAGWGRGYDMVRKDEIGMVPYNGVGDLWLLEKDIGKARALLLEKLEKLRQNDIERAEKDIAYRNLHIVALGGYAAYPDFTRAQEEEADEDD